MLKFLGMLLATVVTSMYFFPFVFTFLPVANTKMMLAAAGLALLIVNLSRSGRHGGIDGGLFRLSVWAMAISTISFAAVVFNGTHDYTFATYVVSMWVWLGGAYAVTRTIHAVHGYLSVELVCHYLIAVCVTQCFIAYAMGQEPALKDFVDSFLAGEGFMGKVKDRLYGIGAALDVAGMKFAAVLVIISFLCANVRPQADRTRLATYLASFLVIVYVGNMIGRTTTVGACMALAYWVFALFTGSEEQKAGARTTWLMLGGALLVALPIVIYYYNTSAFVHSNLRFAFEGFFSLAEKGRWETHSNEILKNMYTLPDNMKTWLIGDGYMDNPTESDPYYIGYAWKGFYHGTDVGYLRFIFYAGIFCMAAFVVYMFYVARTCITRFRPYSLLFAAILALNYIVWFKVSSDLFAVFALFLCMPADDGQTLLAHDCQPSL